MKTLLALLVSLICIAPVYAYGPFALPEQAAQVSPGVYYLGATMSHGERVDGYAFVHAAAKSSAAKAPRAPLCYGFLASGAKWKTVEPYVVNGVNPSSIDAAQMAPLVASDIATWENAAQRDIFGAGSSTTATLTADSVAPDDQNELYFGPIAKSGTIAVTTVWGVFGGPVNGRKLIEWDMVLNTAYPWSVAGDAGSMDVENILTHELGHAVGLGDLYDSRCSSQTMYGYASLGDTNKRTLDTGDVAGVRSLYS